MSEPGVEDLEGRLDDLAAHLRWPPTPDLVGMASNRLSTTRGGDHRRGSRRILVAAAVVVSLAVSLIAWSGGRRAVADLLGLRGVHISTSHPPPVPTTTPQSRHLDLGQPVSVTEASRRIGFPVRIPTLAGFDRPDGIYVATPPPEGEVTLMYLPTSSLPVSAETGVGLLVTEFRGTMEAGFFAKVAEPGTTIEALSVHRQAGFWLSGAPHAFFYRGPGGDIYADSLRLAGNTLVWQSGPVTLRVEGDISKAQALAIANSLG